MSNIKIQDVAQRIQYVATNLQTVYSVPYPFFETTDLVVYQGSTVLNLGAAPGEYGVSGAGSPSGGSVTFVTGATTGDIITITDNLAIDRTSIYSATISNLSGADLNGDFNREVVMLKQIETKQDLMQLQYYPYAEVSQDPTVTIDRWLPVLEASQVWVKNAGNTAMVALSAPAAGLAPSDATYITQTANSDLSAEQALGALVSGFMSSTTTTGVVANRILTGTTGQVDVTNGDGGGDPVLSLSTSVDTPGTFTVGSSTVISSIIDDDSMGTAAATNVPSSESVKAYVDAAKSASKVNSVAGTSNEIVIDSSDPVNPIVGLADNAAMPGVAGLQLPTGTTAQRVTPTSPAINLRYNTDNTAIEYYDHGVPGWVDVDTSPIGNTLNSVQYNNAGAFDGSANFTTDGTTVAITGDLDVDNININGNSIISSDAAGDINLTPNTTGDLVLDGVKWPQATGTIGQVLETDGVDQSAWVDTVSPVNLQDETYVYAVDTGAANALVVSFTPAVLAYKDGQKFSIKVAARNTGATTINVDGLGLKDVRHTDDSVLLEGNLLPTKIYSFVYNATSAHFKVEDPERQPVYAQGFYNGGTLADFSADVTSNGTTITLTFEDDGGGDVTAFFSSGIHVIDSTPALTIALTAGTAAVPVTNYTYILQSAPSTLVNSTSGWPTAEHLTVAETVCQTAALLQTQGAYSHHVWSEHVADSSGEGQMVDINRWIRHQPATWVSGIATTAPSIGAGVFDIATSTGSVLQLHEHDFPAFDTSGADFVLVANDSTGAYTQYANLTTLVTDAAGNSLSGKYYNICVFGVVSQNAADCQLMVNLPNGSYNHSSSAVDDVDSTTIYTIPGAFKGAGFLIARLTIRNQSGSGGTFTLENNEDLRGLVPATATGSGIGGISALIDDPNPTLANDLNMSTFGLKDANGNALVEFGTTASAVNEVTVANAATANDPTISATGGDTNVGFNLNSKGSGKLTVNSGGSTVAEIVSSAASSFVGLQDSSALYTYLGSTSGLFKIQTPGSGYSTKLAVTSAGNVGVGTEDPAAKLDVVGDIESSTWVKTGSYTVAGVPSASTAGAGSLIFVTDETGGAITAFSDGTNWRRMTDRAVVS